MVYKVTGNKQGALKEPSQTTKYNLGGLRSGMDMSGDNSNMLPVKSPIINFIKSKENLLGWVAATFALAGQIAMIFQNPIAFVLWTVGEAMMLFFAFTRKSWGETAFFTCYVVTNLVALYTWQN
jgi:hypothetical protein